MASHCRISRSEPALAQGAYHIEILGVTRPEQLFLRPYGDSNGAEHYDQYLRSVSEASAQVRGAKSPR